MLCIVQQLKFNAIFYYEVDYNFHEKIVKKKDNIVTEYYNKRQRVKRSIKNINIINLTTN